MVGVPAVGPGTPVPPPSWKHRTAVCVVCPTHLPARGEDRNGNFPAIGAAPEPTTGPGTKSMQRTLGNVCLSRTLEPVKGLGWLRPPCCRGRHSHRVARWLLLRTQRVRSTTVRRQVALPAGLHPRECSQAIYIQEAEWCCG